MSASFGLVLPSSTGGDVPEPQEIWSVVEAADASVLSHLWISDHILWWRPMYDSLTLLAAAAARTERIGVGTAVLQLAMRHPITAAKALASISRLAGNRLTVGVGVGGEFPPEWDAMGVSRNTRGRRTDEMISALRGLWAGPFSFRGRYVDLEEIDLHPKPVFVPPIWIGGRTDASVERAARVGDGWMGIFLDPVQYAERLRALANATSKEGRGVEDILPSLYVWTCIADTTQIAREKASIVSAFYNLPFEKLERYVVYGSTEDCAARFRAFEEAGVRHFAVAPISDDAQDQMTRLTAEVLPLL